MTSRAEHAIADLLIAIRAVDPSVSVRDADADADAEKVYAVRAKLIYKLIAFAAELGWPAGYGVDVVELPPGTGSRPVLVAYVELPDVGQLSWHLAPYPKPWDGHTTPEKYTRIDAYVERTRGSG